MDQWNPISAFKQAMETDDHLARHPAILAWFRARSREWQQETEGVLEFYITTVEHPASEPEPPLPDSPFLNG